MLFCERQRQTGYFARVPAPPSIITLLVLSIGLAGMGLSSASCAHHGVVDDGTTISHGWSYDGILKNGLRIPDHGDGYWVPRRWQRRGNLYGTEELVTMLVRVARRVHERGGGHPMGIADLSPPGGGPSPWHRSHQTGRDVDILFFGIDRKGRPLENRKMIPFDENGRSREQLGRWRSWVYFDLDRNWLLIKELLREPTVDIQYLYIYLPLKHLLLNHAREIGEPEELIARADALMEQPENSGLHDDHLHVRLYCPENDRAFGCLDAWQPPWHRTLSVHAWALSVLGNQILRAVSHLSGAIGA